MAEIPMSPAHAQPGRRWLPKTGEFAGQYGTECCASDDFA